MDKKYRVLWWDIPYEEVITAPIEHYADAYNFAYNRGGVVLQEVVNFRSLYWEGEEE